MARLTPTSVMFVGAIGVAVSLFAAGCGTSGTTDAPTSAGSGSVLQPLQPEPSPGDGLALRIAGPVEGEVLCRGDVGRAFHSMVRSSPEPTARCGCRAVW